MLELLQSILPALQPQPLHFLNGHFVWDGPSGYWVPAQPADGRYPLLMADTPRIRLSEDLSLATHDWVLMYAEPHAENLSDVPQIQFRARQTLQQALALLLEQAEAELAAEPEIVFFLQAGTDRLAGANATLSLRLANSIGCC